MKLVEYPYAACYPLLKRLLCYEMYMKAIQRSLKLSLWAVGIKVTTAIYVVDHVMTDYDHYVEHII